MYNIFKLEILLIYKKRDNKMKNQNKTNSLVSKLMKLKDDKFKEIVIDLLTNYLDEEIVIELENQIKECYFINED